MSSAAPTARNPAFAVLSGTGSRYARFIVQFFVILVVGFLILPACARQGRDTTTSRNGKASEKTTAPQKQERKTALENTGQNGPDATKPAVRKLPETLKLKILAAHPHDPDAFTQGLAFRNGILYESTGHYGRSTLRKVEIASGKVLQKVDLSREFFAEGIEIVGQYLFLLTWQEKRCFVFDRDSFRQIAVFPYEGEGWGLCYDGNSLILSDGSATLRFFDPKNFKQTGKLAVYDGKTARTGRPVAELNELEFIHGEIWANVWKETRIARIDPTTGRVIGWIDLTPLVPEQFRQGSGRQNMMQYGENVLNGIAFDPATERFYVTGKNWPVLYEIAILPDAPPPSQP